LPIRRSHRRAIAVVGTGNDALATHQRCVPADSLGDQLPMLDVVGLKLEHPRNEDLALRETDALKEPPLVRVPRIGRLERHTARAGCEDDVDNVRERHIVVMGLS